MQMIRKKIKSRRGASLTFALLLFLVCAVIGSVVLTAGTVAAGRMSQVAEMDQRYYSVNSAARTLIDLIDGKESTIIETRPSADDTGSTFTDETNTPISTSFKTITAITDEAAYYMSAEGPLAKPTLTGGSLSTTNTRKTTPYEFTISVTGGGSTEELKPLKATVSENIEDDGKMILTVKSDDGKYDLKLFFNMDLMEVTDHQEAEKRDIITRIYAWHIRDIQVGRAVGAQRWREVTTS